ncbi:MAG: GAF domain-containing protein, partial [Parvularculaceae bacterium]|nr:GAF domain-containing protein [Parvularculaceae bacterium]
AQARAQTQSARSEAKTSRELLGLARGLASAASEDEVAQTTAAFTARAFDADCAVFARVGVDDIRLAGAAPDGASLSEADMAAAKWTADKGAASGRGSDTLPGGRWLFIPMRTARLFAGVLSVARDAALTPSERRRLDAMADQAATALERAHIARAFEESRVETERERLRATMLSSLSHDLKTPIAGVLGAASSLRAYGARHDEATRAELLAGIEQEAGRMQRYVEKLLDMTRLDAGGLKAKSEPLDVADVVAAVLKRAEPLANGEVWLAGDIAPGLPLLRADRVLLEQALFNLLENAIVHGKRGGENGGTVLLRARRHDDGVAFEVEDEGAGIPPGADAKIFDKFYRGERSAGAGTGLGLAIVKGF